MKKQINWVEILEKNEEAILGAGRQAYRNACSTVYDNSFSNTEDVVIDQDGEIRNQTMQLNWDSMDCREGRAMVAISFKHFNPWENVDEQEAIKNRLSPTSMNEFQTWLTENEISSYGIRELREWNSEIGAMIDDEFAGYDIDDHMEEQVQSSFDRTMESIKAQMSFSE